jgi:soluble lytic murein transglycosylase-like protein
MSISAAQSNAQLASLTATRQKYDKSAAADTGFSAQLDQAVATESSTKSAAENARELAESLSLQMLHTSLALGGDSAAETSATHSSHQPLSSVKALLQAYQANLSPGGQSLTSPLPGTASPQTTISPLAETGAATPPDTHTSGRDWLEPIIAKASGQYGVNADLIRAVIRTESNFNPQAVSPAGARGLMQLMPATARGLGVSDSFNPEQNVMAGTRFLRDLLQRYDGNLDSALAAYNWGSGNMDRRPEQMPRETRDYLVRVKQSYASYSV